MKTRLLVNSSVIAALLAGASLVSAEIDVKLADLSEGKLRVTMTNTSDSPISLLRYQTPLDSLENSLFLVEKPGDGEEIQYIGRLALRVGPFEENWLTLKGHQSLMTEVDLTKNYAMYEGGKYSVKFSFPLTIRNENGTSYNLETFDKEITSEPIIFNLTDGVKAQPRLASAGDRHNIVSCNSSQSNNLNIALKFGQELSKKSFDSLTGGQSDTRYPIWFGAYSSSNYERVKSNYKKIDQSFNSSWTLTCTQDSNCSKGVLAYVYPGQTFSVFICDYFHTGGWSQNYLGSLLLHESSHWNTVAGTKDHGYGAAFCKNLAKSDPARAISNADTYRFYALDLVGEAK